MHYLRFKNLKEMGLVTSWPRLKDLIDNHNFPAGRRQGDRERIWTSDEIADYTASLPAADEKAPALRGGAKTRAKRVELAATERDGGADG